MLDISPGCFEFGDVKPCCFIEKANVDSSILLFSFEDNGLGAADFTSSMDVVLSQSEELSSSNPFCAEPWVAPSLFCMISKMKENDMINLRSQNVILYKDFSILHR